MLRVCVFYFLLSFNGCVIFGLEFWIELRNSGLDNFLGRKLK